MIWDYRVVKHRTSIAECVYSIHQVHYDADGNPVSCSADAVIPSAATAQELGNLMIHMISALSKPVLDYSLFMPDPDPKSSTNSAIDMLRKS